MKLEKKARLVLENFGREKQELKQIEEEIELEIALFELAKHDIKNKFEEIKDKEVRKNLVYNCNDEMADNVFMRMQLTGADFEKCYNFEVTYRCTKQYIEMHYLENFTFDKEEVRRICCEKADRTLERYNIKVEE